MIDYRMVRRIGEKQYQKALSKGWYPYLPALDDLIHEEEMVGEVPLGTMEIPVHMIAGTKTHGRNNAFSYKFMPLLDADSEFAAKWTSLYDIQVEQGFTDPIKVYEFMHRFYVIEGNKRVSVMKYLNGDSILANVVRIIPPLTEDADRQLYYEFLDFYNVTRYYGIEFSELGSYERLAEHFGQNLTDPWPEETIELMKNTFVYFGVLLAEKGGGELPITAGDALLIYLNVYRAETLTDHSPTLMKSRLDRLWKEFQVGEKDEHIDLIDNPEEAESAKPVLPMFRLLSRGNRYSEAKPLRVGYIHDTNIQESGRIAAYEEGRLALQKRFGRVVRTKAFFNCDTDERVKDAIDSVVQDGAEVVITTSPSLMPVTFKSAIHYPDVRFLNCSVKMTHQAVRTFYLRMYESKFVLGAIAACMADNHRIGYRAQYPIFGVVANINAFAAGAAMIDPKCRIYLAWSTKEESDWREELKDSRVSIISGADVLPLKNRPSDEQGVFKRDDDGNPIPLALPTQDWGHYYELIVQTILNGTYDGLDAAKNNQAINYWYGMSAGVVDVKLTENIPAGVRKLAEYLRQGVLDGTLSPFEGELRDQDGNIRLENGRMTMEDIVDMDWLLENIVGGMPKFEELRSTAQGMVSISGVLK